MPRRRLVLAAGALLLAGLGIVAWLLADERELRVDGAAAPPTATSTPTLLPDVDPTSPDLPAAPTREAFVLDVPAEFAGERQVVFAGRVVSEERAPLAGARVDFLHSVALPGVPFEADEGASLLAHVTSGDDGRFSLAIAESLARVVAKRSQGDATHFPLLRVGAARCATTVVRIAPSDADLVDVGDIVLAHGGSVRGRVVDEEGRPVPEACVSCQRTDRDPEFGYLAKRTEATTTVADGRFALAGLRAGQISLRLEAPARGVLTSPVVTLSHFVELGSRELDLAAGEMAQVEFFVQLVPQP